MLKIINIDSDIACDGVQAIEMCRVKKYSMIFMDYYMPGMSGPDATKAIKNDTHTNNANTIIIGLTASGTEESFKKMIDSGMTYCISKPVQMDCIKEICVKYCENYK